MSQLSNIENSSKNFDPKKNSSNRNRIKANQINDLEGYLNQNK